MNEISVSSVDELIRQLNQLPNHYIYRGEADASRVLQSSLERVVGDAWTQATAERFENYSFNLFRSKFHLYDSENVEPASKLGWLSIMQHYGVPTRLLDFTESPYIALYFALEAYQPQARKSLAVYALDYTALMQRSIDSIKAQDPTFVESRQSVHQKQDDIFERVLEPGNFEVVWAAEPNQFNTRLDRQAGCFLFSGTKAQKLGKVLASQTYRGCDFRKFVIQPDLYTGIFALLRKMNITSKSIYGNLDGLARSIKMQMQIYAAPQPTYPSGDSQVTEVRSG